MSPSAEERDFQKGRWRDVAIRKTAASCSLVAPPSGRGGPKTVRYAGIAMEQLDHRQLLSVNFTGNVPIDFPATQVPGVVVLPDNPLVQHPTIAPIVNVSGFDASGIRVSYSPYDDTLNIGLDQPHA